MLASRHDANVWIKDEGLNPTGSFKARGLCMAVTMAKAYGIKKAGGAFGWECGERIGCIFRRGRN